MGLDAMTSGNVVSKWKGSFFDHRQQDNKRQNKANQATLEKNHYKVTDEAEQEDDNGNDTDLTKCSGKIRASSRDL